MNNYFKPVINDYRELVSRIVSTQASPALFTKEGYSCIESLLANKVASYTAPDMRVVNFLVSIRTDRTNELVLFPDDRFVTICPVSYSFEEFRPTLDYAILSAKSAFERAFDSPDYSKAVQRTSFYPVGGAFIDNQVFVLSHIIIDRTLLDDLSLTFKDSCHFQSIKDVSVEQEIPVLSAVLKTLQIYTEEE